MKKLPMLGILTAAQVFAGGTAWAALKVADIADLDLEQLTKITVTSASRREERLVDAPASIFVITAEDIRRSGATSLPEILRLAPNLQVARGDANQYIVSARGGLSGTANKMLVLIDGRTLYTPLFAGVFYDALSLFIDDIERVEVISGPGSTLWGTNAVNGVINVTTKSAHKTEGALVNAGGGNQESGAAARIGWSAGDGSSVRAYARYLDRDEFRLASGASAQDASNRWQTGFRGDWEMASGSATLQGDAYKANVGNLGGPRDLSGGNLLARWQARLEGDDTLQVQSYLDRTQREHVGSFRETLDTFDIELQHLMHVSPDHHVGWGASYRAARDRTDPTAVLGFVPANRTLSYGSLFAQDEIALTPMLRATVGLRAERNPYSGLEWLPNARLSYTVSNDHVLWAALTRAVRAPSRIDRDLVVPGFPPFVIVNNDTFVSEIADVAEIGYRANLSARTSLSFNAFHHRFRDLRTLEPGAGAFVVSNGAEGRLTGLEGWGEWRPVPDWRLAWGFTLMDEKTQIDPGHVNLTDPPLGNNPRQTWLLRSLWNVTSAMQLDLMLRHVGRLPNPEVPAYTELNGRLGWRVNHDLDISLVVINALDRDHVEFGTAAQRAVFPPGYYVKVTWAY